MNDKLGNAAKARVLDLAGRSGMSVTYAPHRYLEMQIWGPAAAIPSVSNSKNIFINPGGALSILRELLVETDRRKAIELCEKAIAKIQDLKPIIGRKPNYIERIEALKLLWATHRPASFRPFETEIDSRLFLVLWCDESLRLNDTHNILKAACDFCQEVGIFKNDRHVDALALRASDFGRTGSHIRIVPLSTASDFLCELFVGMTNPISRQQIRPGMVAGAVQRSMF